jgi:hypothetical protein
MDDHKPSPDQLQRSLAQLHDVLVRTPRVDAASKQLLRDVLGDIERLLSSGAREAAQSQSRLEALAVGFEAEHPSLSASLREFIDLLGRAGM